MSEARVILSGQVWGISAARVWRGGQEPPRNPHLLELWPVTAGEHDTDASGPVFPDGAPIHRSLGDPVDAAQVDFAIRIARPLPRAP